MDRKEFLKVCGLNCLLGAGIISALQSCAGSNYMAQHSLEENTIKVPLSEFYIDNDPTKTERKHIIVRPEKLNFPIYVYKISATEYSAVWMECTHQGAELTAHGDFLSCPSHGSEFDKQGKVVQGPAQENLRKFKTSTNASHIIIYLA